MHRPIGSLWRYRLESITVKSTLFRVTKHMHRGCNHCEVVSGQRTGEFATLKLDNHFNLWELITPVLPEGI